MRPFEPLGTSSPAAYSQLQNHLSTKPIRLGPLAFWAFVGQRCFRICLLTALLGSCFYGLIFMSPACLAQETNLDKVVVANRIGDQQQTLSGRILAYNGKFLTFQLLGGSPQRIETSRVKKIQSAWTAKHLRGDQLLADHEFEQALLAYQQAVKEETRLWARQRILAQWVWCYRGLSQTEQAGEHFLKVVLAGDPDTLYFDTIPLTWGKQAVSPTLEGRAQSWLTDSRSSAGRLLGASWLLGTAQRATAIQVLKQLTTDTDTRIALLAEAQLWRTQQASISVQGLGQWKGQIGRLPVELRPGPYFLLGAGLHRHQQHEQAIVAWMRVPINYSQHYQLAAEALLASAKKMDQLQRESQARNLYQEIVSKYGTTVAAGQAQRWLDQAQSQNQPPPQK